MNHFLTLSKEAKKGRGFGGYPGKMEINLHRNRLPRSRLVAAGSTSQFSGSITTP